MPELSASLSCCHYPSFPLAPAHGAAWRDVAWHGARRVVRQRSSTGRGWRSAIALRGAWEAPMRWRVASRADRPARERIPTAHRAGAFRDVRQAEQRYPAPLALGAPASELPEGGPRMHRASRLLAHRVAGARGAPAPQPRMGPNTPGITGGSMVGSASRPSRAAPAPTPSLRHALASAHVGAGVPTNGVQSCPLAAGHRVQPPNFRPLSCCHYPSFPPAHYPSGAARRRAAPEG